MNFFSSQQQKNICPLFKIPNCLEFYEEKVPFGLSPKNVSKKIFLKFTLDYFMFKRERSSKNVGGASKKVLLINQKC